MLGSRVIWLLLTYANSTHFRTTELAYEEVRTHLLRILARRGIPTETIAQLLEKEVLGRLPILVGPVPLEVYADFEAESRRRLAKRDEADWPFLALALALRLDCPIWTEDPDFFGSGVATWTTDRVEFYLQSDL